MEEIATKSYRAKKARGRAERRERALARVRVPASPSRGEQERRGTRVPVWLSASLATHVGIAALAFIVPSSARDDRSFEQAVELLEPPKPPPPPTEVAAPEPSTPPIEPVVARPTKAPTPLPPPTAKDEPPPDPIQAAASEPTPSKPARRVVGLNLDSTVAGNGPAFAVGNTRMGETSRTAGDPNAAAPLPGAQFVPPRRVHEVQPDYPPALRAQSVEGEVGLKVDVDAQGHVTNVVVVTPSPQAAFNAAAVAAAKASSYSPALMNATPVANTIQFTVRFRLKH